MRRIFPVILSLVALLCGTAARAADEPSAITYAGKVMLEIIVFYPKEFDQLDAKTKDQLTQAMKANGAEECKDGLRMPTKPLVGAWLKVGTKPIMTDTNGDFVLSSLPPGTTEIPIFQQLSDRVSLAKFPVKRLVRKGEKVQPFVISMRMPLGECHTGKVDHTN